jgi:hypothetical protein
MKNEFVALEITPEHVAQRLEQIGADFNRHICPVCGGPAEGASWHSNCPGAPSKQARDLADRLVIALDHEVIWNDG